MLKSIINPDLSGKRFSLILGMMLIMLLAMSTGLMAQTATPPVSGDGTSGNPYQIATLDNLYWITQNSGEWSAHYIQIADIDASTTSGWDSGAGFSPIGNITTNFTGSYNGNGHNIDNLYINRSLEDYIGFFGYAANSTISNLGLTNVNITAHDHVGGFAGENRYLATINNCFSSGTVSGNKYVGGFVGYAYNSSTTTSANILNCYSRCTVSGTSSTIGGFVGYNYRPMVVNCYSTGTVSGSSRVGGLIGDNRSGTITNSFWDTQTSGQSGSDGGTGKTTAEMKTQSTFTDAGWDFTTPIWKIDGTNNDGYPYLGWESYASVLGHPIPRSMVSAGTRPAYQQ
jgi:hypothetical protein